MGVDRDDVVGALDAFVGGGERTVDLAEVNGRVFVNNVSLGLYGDAVERAGYRDAKLRTMLDVLPDVAGPDGRRAPITWRDSDGLAHEGGLGVLISNNAYRLGRLVGSGTRPQLDGGRLGVAVMGPANWRHRGVVREWSPRSIEVDGELDVPAGIDGEAALLTPPIRFRSRPGVLRVRIAAGHPGCSPSAGVPSGVWSGARHAGPDRAAGDALTSGPPPVAAARRPPTAGATGPLRPCPHCGAALPRPQPTARPAGTPSAAAAAAPGPGWWRQWWRSSPGWRWP